jgi:hypothetical protein
MTIRVVIADDHRVVRAGLCYLLGREPDVEVAGEAGDGRQTVDVAAIEESCLLRPAYPVWSAAQAAMRSAACSRAPAGSCR